ncbi:6-carboxy-5,6,7,8-tetrahydropterin synthase [Enterobacteria phage 9g]|uniref:6-carboxy-5,6,7,8-tetrahydropterin synthase n=1 Tax=Enterobacteria phage 9g TaxID=1468411 RepID=X2KTT1_9CAUD|nr:QueD-like 6-pyruvoyl-tetrahydropterin synthase [Enterobacteria phage 9g]AHN84521.1 6-carboxy-5,6,7,8-tetrahydropterin synthase [Enterobacteria phage 9g]QBQ81058.1 putative queuosine biosynthesis protein [Escherichia phage vB_EcoS_HdSG1]
MGYTVIRSHEICAGHRVVGHESKCRHLHGHNYKFHFKVAPKKTLSEGYVKSVSGFALEGSLDDVGRVIDFSVVKTTLCQWLEDNWDHKFLHWEQDSMINSLIVVASTKFARENNLVTDEDYDPFFNSLVALPFNPTAENLAAYMVDVIGPQLLDQYGVELVECTIEETSKCHVNYCK